VIVWYLDLQLYMQLMPITTNVVSRGRDRMVVGFTITYALLMPITTNAVSSNPVHGEVYNIMCKGCQ